MTLVPSECAWNSELWGSLVASCGGADSVSSHRCPHRVWRGRPSTGLVEGRRPSCSGSVAGTWQTSRSGGQVFRSPCGPAQGGGVGNQVEREVQ